MVPGRGVHAAGFPFLMASSVKMPAATARSPQRRTADQNIVLHLARQKRCADPPRRARKGRPHHGHTGEVVILTGFSFSHREAPTNRSRTPPFSEPLPGGRGLPRALF